MASKPKDDHKESINGQAIVKKYVALRIELNQLCLKVNEMKIRTSKHRQVSYFIRLLDPSRECYWRIGALSTLRTIREVLSDVQKKEELLEVIIAELHEALENKKKEIAELQFKIAMDSFYQEELQEFEELFELEMTSYVVQATDELNKINEQKKVFLDLKRDIQGSWEKSATSDTLGFEAYVADTQHIVMDIGLGIQMQLTLSEALRFMSEIEAMLIRQILQYNVLIHFIKAQMNPNFLYLRSHGSFKYMKPLRFRKIEEGYLELDNELNLDEGHEVDDTFAEHEDNPADTTWDKFVFGKTSGKMNREARPSISHAFKGIHIRRHLRFDKKSRCMQRFRGKS